MQSEEEYLGGFISNRIGKPGFNSSNMLSFGVYATNRRIMVVRLGFSELRGAPEGFNFGSAPEVVLVNTRRRRGPLGERKLTKDEGAKIIAWLDSLDKKKDFEVSKEQVSQIEIKRPGMLSPGDLKFTLTSGEEYKLVIGARFGRQNDFELTLGLMQAFLPEAVRLVQ